MRRGTGYSEDRFVFDLGEELAKARTKFPDTRLVTVALMEEVGELAQAYLDLRYGIKTFEQVYREAVQVAAMAMRIATEGDPAFLDDKPGDAP